METDGNWIKINRSILQWEWRSSPKHYSVFCYCLERAHYKEKTFKGVLMQAGSFPTSHAEIAQFTGLTTRQVRGCLNDLKKSGELVTKSNRKGTVITVKNWFKYQCSVTETGKEAAVKESVKCQETGGKVSTNKKVKKEKNEKNNTPVKKSQASEAGEKVLGLKQKAEDILLIWNTMAAQAGLEKALTLNKKRLRHIKKALDENPNMTRDDWVYAAAQTSMTPWAMGESSSGWKANFDWFIAPEKQGYLRMLEAYKSANEEVTSER